MPRHMLRNSFAAALIGAAAASSAAAQDILVTAPEQRIVERTNIGAEVVENTASVVVNIRDLNLASAAGWNAMEKRLASASRVACNTIEQRIPIDLRTDGSNCARIAYRHAIARIRD